MEDVYKFKNPQQLIICASNIRRTDGVIAIGGRQDTNTPKEGGSGTD